MTDWSEFELSDDEFDALPADQQRRYLRLLHSTVNQWRLTPIQQEAERRAHMVDDLLFGGAAGGGKTNWLIWHAYHLSLKYPGHKSLLIRRTHPNLRRTVIRECHRLFDPDLTTWRAADKEYHFDNGSIIEFGFCDSEEDHAQYLSAEYDLIAFEEAGELQGDWLAAIATRARTTRKKARMGIHPHVVYTTNPGGPGHTYLKQMLVEPTNYGELESAEIPTVDEFGEPILDPRTNKPIPPRRGAFVPSRVEDNPHIDPTYIARLAAMSEVKRKMWLDGDWDVFEGRFFTEFDRAIHVVDLDPADLPDSWFRWCACDWGFSRPWSCHWYAADPDGNIYVYRELYGPGRYTSQQAADWKRSNGSDPVRDIYADPAVFKDGGGKGTGLSTAGQWREHGFRVRPAKNERKPGWARVRDYLRVEHPPTCKACDGAGCPECNGLGVIQIRPEILCRSDEDRRKPAPALYVSRYCPALIDELVGAQFADNDPEDLNTKLEWKVNGELRGDHALDDLRYAVMTRPPRRPHTVVERAGNAIRTAADIMRARRRKPDGGWTSSPNPADT